MKKVSKYKLIGLIVTLAIAASLLAGCSGSFTIVVEWPVKNEFFENYMGALESNRTSNMVDFYNSHVIFFDRNSQITDEWFDYDDCRNYWDEFFSRYIVNDTQITYKHVVTYNSSNDLALVDVRWSTFVYDKWTSKNDMLTSNKRFRVVKRYGSWEITEETDFNQP